MEDPSKQHGPGKQSEPVQSSEVDRQQAVPDQLLREGLPTGSGLGKYRILERLYSTYNGAVYKARDMLLDRLVTIKQMNPALLDDPIACGLFKREAQFLARIPRGSRYIINIHELIELDRGLFIAGEYVNGRWLDTLISKRHLDVMSALKILRASTMGLRTLHGLSMVHRGIHPQSLMVTKSMRAMITNLGTSAHEGDTTPVPVLFAQYTAPEILSGRVYDSRVDIYSLGMTLYEYCVGRKHMRRVLDDTAADALTGARLWTDWQRDVARSLPDASELNSAIPVALSSILRRMTAKNLDERFSSCQEVLDALDQHFEIRRVSPTQVHVGIALGIQTPSFAPQTRPPSAVPQRTGSPLLSYQSNTNQPPPLAPATSTHTARQTITQQTQIQPTILPPGVHRPANQQVQPRPTRDVRRVRHIRTVRPSPKEVRPEAIPIPTPVEETHKPRTPRILGWCVAAVLLLALIMSSGYALWYYKAGPGLTSPITQLYDKAMTAYTAGEYESAKAAFEQVISHGATAPKFERLKDDAKTGIRWAQARIELTNDNFDATMRIVREGEKSGDGSAEIANIKRECREKREAYRRLVEANEAIERGETAEAELQVRAIENTADITGINTEGLKARLQMSKEDKRFSEAIKRAREALLRKDFEAASLACVDAQRIHQTPETAKLAKDIRDEKRRDRYILQGDDAMLNQAFAAAAEAYDAANQLRASEDTERKARKAKAYVLVERAQEKIESGDLIAAKQDLVTSRWWTRTAEAEAKLSKYSEAFDAAEQAQRADTVLNSGDFETAINLYEEALPNLPPPADAIVGQRLRDARGGWAVKQGDAAFDRGQWEQALKHYRNAKTLGRNGDLDVKIQVMLIRLNRTTTSGPTSSPATP